MILLRPLLTFFLITLFSGCLSDSSTDEPEVSVTAMSQIVGTWKRKSGADTQSLTFKSDGSFFEDDYLNSTRIQVGGIYSVASGQITLTVTQTGFSVTMFDCKVKGKMLSTSQELPTGAKATVGWTKS